MDTEEKAKVASDAAAWIEHHLGHYSMVEDDASRAYHAREVLHFATKLVEFS